MDRYDLFRLYRDLGQLIEGTQDKLEVYRALGAYAQEKLAEAKTADALKQLVNGTAIPILATELLPSPGPNSPSHPTPASAPAGVSQA